MSRPKRALKLWYSCIKIPRLHELLYDAREDSQSIPISDSQVILLCKAFIIRQIGLMTRQIGFWKVRSLIQFESAFLSGSTAIWECHNWTGGKLTIRSDQKLARAHPLIQRSQLGRGMCRSKIEIVAFELFG